MNRCFIHIQNYENGSNCVLASRLYELAITLLTDAAWIFNHANDGSNESYDEEILMILYYII